MQNKHILISGASIAGPALAFWLRHYGFNCTIVERAPALRDGGYGVDFRGPAHMQILEQMSILEDVRRQQTHMGAISYVDQNGRVLASMPAEVFSGEVEILRGDLARILYERTCNEVEYIFDDSISALHDDGQQVQVTFQRGASRSFDLVVGADGLHSGVRGLAFGAEAQYIRDLGYYVAIFTTANHLKLNYTGQFYSVPGKTAGMYSARGNSEAKAMFIFAAPPLNYDRRDTNQQKQIVARSFADVGWEVPRLIEAIWGAPDFYFDSISQIQLENWSRGRIALVGDAAYGATMGGLGTGLAMVGAYILAGELAAAKGDYRLAFARYQQQMREYAKQCQKLAEGAGPFLAPPTQARIWLRNQLWRVLPRLPWKGLINAMTTKTASAIALKDYQHHIAVAELA